MANAIHSQWIVAEIAVYWGLSLAMAGDTGRHGNILNLLHLLHIPDGSVADLANNICPFNMLLVAEENIIWDAVNSDPWHGFFSFVEICQLMNCWTFREDLVVAGHAGG